MDFVVALFVVLGERVFALLLGKPLFHTAFSVSYELHFTSGECSGGVRTVKTLDSDRQFASSNPGVLIFPVFSVNTVFFSCLIVPMIIFLIR